MFAPLLEMTYCRGALCALQVQIFPEIFYWCLPTSHCLLFLWYFFFLVNSQRAFWGFSHFWVYLQNYFRLWLSLSWKFGNVPHLCAFPPLVLFCVMVPAVVGLHQGSGHCDLTGGIPWPPCWEHAWICLHWSTYGALQALEAEMSLFDGHVIPNISELHSGFEFSMNQPQLNALQPWQNLR